MSNPVDVVKVRLLNNPALYPSTFAAYPALLREEGGLGALRGVVPSTLRGAFLAVGELATYDQVKHEIKTRLGLKEGVSNGKLLKNAFFEGGKDSAAEDFLAAAYLLANAFRTNSTTAPDSLPTVKKLKAFMKEYETLLKLAKKKGSEDPALESYEKSVVLLKEYLASVDL